MDQVVSFAVMVYFSLVLCGISLRSLGKEVSAAGFVGLTLTILHATLPNQALCGFDIRNLWASLGIGFVFLFLYFVRDFSPGDEHAAP